MWLNTTLPWNHRTTSERDRRYMRWVRGRANDNGVSHGDEALNRVVGGVLASETHADLGLRIEGDTERRGILGGEGLAQATNTSRYRVSMIEGLCDRFKEPIENRSRRGEVGIYHREIEYLLPFN